MNFLHGKFIKEEKKAGISSFLRKVFVDDWLIKVFALIITLSLWFGVTGLNKPITTRLSGIDLKPRVSSDLEITNSPVTEVDLIVTGDKRRIDQINTENLIISLDLTDVSAGDQSIQLTPENVNLELPPGVRLEEIQPSRIALKLEPVIEREIPVEVETRGELPEGYEFYAQPAAVPEKVVVRGPASFVSSLNSVSTEQIDLTNRRGDFTAQQVPLSIVNPRVTQLTPTVDVVFKISENRVERLFLVPFKTEEGQKRAKIVLYGERSLFENITSEDIRIEYLELDKGETSLNIILPEKLQDKVEIREKTIMQ